MSSSSSSSCGVSMHRFINSKGRSVASANGAATASGLSRFASHQNLCFNASTNDYQSLAGVGERQATASACASDRDNGTMDLSSSSSSKQLLSSVSPSVLAVVSSGRSRKGSISAESKIQQELREMRAREEELRYERDTHVQGVKHWETQKERREDDERCRQKGNCT